MTSNMHTSHITLRHLVWARAIAAELALGGNVKKAKARAAGYGFDLAGKTRGEVLDAVNELVRKYRG